MEPDPDEIRRMLQQVDLDGWDNPVGRALLAHVRRHVVARVVRRSGLVGPAADQAAASAWAAAWDALRRPSARTADSPLGLAWVAARRAVWAELGGVADGPEEGVRIVSLDAVGAAGLEPVDLPATDERFLGASLELLVEALERHGWEPSVVREAVGLLADQSAPGAGVGMVRVPWRWVAVQLGLPDWRVRRLAVLLVGRPGLPGLLERVAIDGPDMLGDPEVLDALAATTRQWMSSPDAYLAERETRETPALRRAS